MGKLLNMKETMTDAFGVIATLYQICIWSGQIIDVNIAGLPNYTITPVC